MAELVVTVDVDAPAERTWWALVDWERQGEWMLGTSVRATSQHGHGVGAGLEAVTGFGPMHLRDTMVVSQWEPPRRCVVRHTGRLIRGAGAFEVEPLPDGRARVVWSEWLDLPLGLVGQLGWLGVRPLTRLGLGTSLRRFAEHVRAAE